MEREEIRQLLNGIFEIVLNHPGIQLEDRMTADDIDNWDSLTNMTIISEIERQWQIHFKLRDIIRMKNVGDMIDTILAKSDQ
ncbi:MAG TPA: acyl carrier protein [Prevotella sp.]|nr:acyl carrier protein [Prevotella sp.]